MRCVPTIGLLALGLLRVPAASADQVVHFADGRSMPVAQAELRPDGTVLLTLRGGGAIAVPRARVERWELLVSPPAPEPTTAPVAEAWKSAAGPYAALIERAARRYRVDPVLLTAMAQVESSFDPDAVSPKGAQGLLQLMPDTARRFGVDDALDAEQNLDGGARYLGWLLQRYSGETELALAGYNAGEAAVDRYSGIPPYTETRNYVSRVLAGAQRLGSPEVPVSVP